MFVNITNKHPRFLKTKHLPGAGVDVDMIILQLLGSRFGIQASSSIQPWSSSTPSKRIQRRELPEPRINNSLKTQIFQDKKKLNSIYILLFILIFRLIHHRFLNSSNSFLLFSTLFHVYSS